MREMLTITLILTLLAPVPALAGEADPADPVGPAGATAAKEEGGEVKLNPKIVEAEPNKWLKLHEQTREDEVHFDRQAHGGSCFDSKRGRIVLFGSNTHGKDWKNSPFFFDVAEEKWSRAYPDDTRETYKVTEEGLPVAGEKGDHPWATHTFGAVVYDPGRDEMVVACYPGHMVPGRFTNSVNDLWRKVKKHPNWVYKFETGEWSALDCKPVHFFPNAAAWNPDREAVMGYGGKGIWELVGEPREWKQFEGRSMFGWHNNAVYDPKNKSLVVFGTNKDSNDIVTYKPETEEHKKMPAAGERPPADQHNPMAYDPENEVTVVVVDRLMEGESRKDKNAKLQAEAWLYDLSADAWTQLPEATLPFGCAMNYTMEYDPNHKACLLVAGHRRQPTTVYVLKVDREKIEKK